MKKTFDCVEMKRKIQEQVYQETRRMTPKKEIEYFHRSAREFWEQVDSLRQNREKLAVGKRGKSN